METKNEITRTVQYGSPQEDDLKAAYEKGRKVGRLEGMIAYQKHLVGNLQKENEKLTTQLANAMA